MNGNKEETRDLLIDIASPGNGVTMFYDRFNIVVAAPVAFITFWRSGNTEDRFSCVMPLSDVRNHAHSLKRYVEKVGIHPGDLPEMVGERIPPKEKAPIVRAITCTRTDEVAETGLLFFPASQLLNSPKGSPIGARLEASLLSSIETQINFLVNIIQVGESK